MGDDKPTPPKKGAKLPRPREARGRLFRAGRWGFTPLRHPEAAQGQPAAFPAAISRALDGAPLVVVAWRLLKTV